MRTLTRDFSRLEQGSRGQAVGAAPAASAPVSLRSTDPDVLDGAFFTYVTSAGTDPEALLLIEARKPSPDDSPIWHYAIARFTDLQLSVQHKGNEVDLPVDPAQLARSRWQGPLPRVPR